MRGDLVNNPPGVRISIDGKEGIVAPRSSILDAATRLGIEIPTLCHHPDLSPVGSCRLCLVEIAGRSGQFPACVEPVFNGMRVTTESELLRDSRRFQLEMLRSRYLCEEPADDNDPSEFERLCREYNISESRQNRRYQVDSDPNPFIQVDLNQCILCTRCVRACEEVQGRFVLGVGERGEHTKIIAGLDTSLLDARCESCGACAAYCPTEALTDRMSIGLGAPDRKVLTTCGYCGVGCQFDLNVKDNRVIGVTSARGAPVNGMSLCVKGRYGYDFLSHPDRLRKPMIRQYLLDGLSAADRPADRGPWAEVDWKTALSVVAQRLTEFCTVSGPDSIGFLSSAKCTNEENYLLQKIARQLFGTNNVDHCARLCHSSTVAGLGMAFGSGAMSNSMDDVSQHAEAMLVIGSNTTEQHPVFGAMLRQAVLRRGVKIVVADPRKIDLTEFAALHLRQRPGTDVALLNGLMYLALKNNWHDEDFIGDRCEGFEALRTTVQGYPPERVSQITGIPEKKLHEAATILCTVHPMAVIWAMGITQHTTGVINVLSLANLQMLLGNMGVPGGGVNPLRGQNNVQGACDMGALPNVLPGYQAVGDELIHEKFAKAWATVSDQKAYHVDEGLPQQPGLTVTEMIAALPSKDIRGLFILGEDPAMTEPDTNHVARCLEKAEFIVLQEIFPSETARWADVLLPGAAFAEKSGTFTNTDRRIQPVRQAIDPPGIAQADWQILTRLGDAILRQRKLTPVAPHAAWGYESTAAILDEIAALTPSYAGISWARVDAGERLQWPVSSPDSPGTPILHTGTFTRGKGLFHAVDHLPPEELPDHDYPLLLTTGRVLYHWHGGELTRRARGLLAIYPEPEVEIASEDAANLNIAEGALIRLTSRRGMMVARAVVTSRVPSGVVFGSFHFPNTGNVNNLTNCALDPVAKIPEYKVCAVALEKA